MNLQIELFLEMCEIYDAAWDVLQERIYGDRCMWRPDIKRWVIVRLKR